MSRKRKDSGGLGYWDLVFNFAAIIIVLAMVGVLGIMGFVVYVMWGML